APARHVTIDIGRDITRPRSRTGRRIECVQDAGGTKRVYAAAGQRRGCARPRAAVRLVEAHGVAVHPHRLAGRDVVARDNLVVAALLLRVESAAADRERRPAGTDPATPELRWRRDVPPRVDADAADDAVSGRSAEAGPW